MEVRPIFVWAKDVECIILQSSEANHFSVAFHIIQNKMFLNINNLNIKMSNSVAHYNLYSLERKRVDYWLVE